MMKKIEDLTFYELLEVSPSATSQEIHKAYERTRRVYDPSSIALYSLFTPEETAAIQQRIEDAYRTLMYESHRKKYDEQLKGINAGSAAADTELLYGRTPSADSLGLDRAPANMRKQETVPADLCKPEQQEFLPPPEFDGEFTGPAIKLLREKRCMSIKQIADITKVGARYLELIEEEQYPKLPARAYLRGFLVLYAKTLGYDPERVVSDYLKRYDAAKTLPKK